MEVPRRGGVEWIGDPLENESFIVSFAETRPSEIFIALALAHAKKNGIELTTELMQLLRAKALRREAEYYSAIRARGVSTSIRQLLAAKRKRDVERIAQEITIESSEFHDFLINCRMMGLSRHSTFHHFEPEQRVLTEEERASFLAARNAPVAPASVAEEKVSAKVQQLFVERLHRSVHLFTSANEWHCFFFSFEDISDEENHWSGGSHVHFVSHVFDSRLKKKAAWKALAERRHSIPTVHLRYRDPRQREHDGTLVYVDGRTNQFRKIAPKGKAISR